MLFPIILHHLLHCPKTKIMDVTLIGKPDEERDEAEEKFQKVSEAYEVLGNIELRRKYDNGEEVSCCSVLDISLPPPRICTLGTSFLFLVGLL